MLGDWVPGCGKPPSCEPLRTQDDGGARLPEHWLRACLPSPAAPRVPAPERVCQAGTGGEVAQGDARDPGALLFCSPRFPAAAWGPLRPITHPVPATAAPWAPTLEKG